MCVCVCGRTCMEECGCLRGGVCMEGCVWRGVYGRVCVEVGLCVHNGVRVCVSRRVCVCVCSWRSAPLMYLCVLSCVYGRDRDGDGEKGRREKKGVPSPPPRVPISLVLRNVCRDERRNVCVRVYVLTGRYSLRMSGSLGDSRLPLQMNMSPPMAAASSSPPDALIPMVLPEGSVPP